MQTLNAIQGVTAQDIANEITNLIQSDGCVAIHAVGSETIVLTVSAIGIAKRFFSEDDKVLEVEPIFETQQTHTVEDDELTTSITFKVIAAPLYVTIAAFNPEDEVVQVLN